MTSEPLVGQRSSVRRALSWALIAALCLAAFTAIGAILTGDFDDTDARVIATSLGFGVFSATAASGAALRFRTSENLRSLGLGAMALSAISFLLLLVALWSDGDDEAWRWFGSFAVATLACSHASLVSGALRSTDTPTIQTLGKTSIGLGFVDSLFGILAINGAVDDPDEGFGQLIAVLVILLVLTTALPPILRRLQRSAVAVGPQPGGASTRGHTGVLSGSPVNPNPLAAEAIATADRIEALNADPGNRASEIRRECERLRELARSYSG